MLIVCESVVLPSQTKKQCRIKSIYAERVWWMRMGFSAFLAHFMYHCIYCVQIFSERLDVSKTRIYSHDIFMQRDVNINRKWSKVFEWKKIYHGLNDNVHVRKLNVWRIICDEKSLSFSWKSKQNETAANSRGQRE